MSSATSFVAGFSSALPAAYHFGRIAPYGVLANGLAIPVVGVVVMPMALLSALLMPLGLEQLPLMAMEAGLRLVILVSDYVASLPGADMIAPRPAPWAVLVLAGGLIALCLLRGPVRIGGLLIMALGGIMILKPPLPPDLLIEATGRNVALRDGAGHLVPAWPARARFAVGKWLLANGEEVGMATAAKRHGWRCGPHVCEASLQGRRVVYVSGAEGQRLDCASIDILIADHPLRGACTRVPVRIDRFDLWRSGAAALRIMPQGGIRVETARGQQGARPWVVRPEARARVFTSD